MDPALENEKIDIQETLEKYELGSFSSRVFLCVGILSFVSVLYLIASSFLMLDRELVRDLKEPISAQAANSASELNGFKTNISRVSISLDKLYKEGPTRGFIPGIMNPKFDSARNLTMNISDKGILVKGTKDSAKFYPLRILNWHEVVNDEIDGRSIAVTYSPLTGTSAVFDRNISGEELTFDVTGMLYESNLVMFDTKTESFWSQNERRSIAGDYDNTNLDLVHFELVDAGYVMKNYPKALYMTEETGFQRDYAYDPYKDYAISNIVYPEFGITDSEVNEEHPAKDLLYSVPFEGKVYSILLKDLTDKSSVKFDTDTFTLNIKKSGQEIMTEVISKNTDGSKKVEFMELPGYYEMWFSWAIKHAADGILY
jgi:hypothetical protein